ncbi:hypothetical protein AALO_G00018280 [Alosa alosa]|uniref:Uncharacterized protein n=1 Tax=Alosa alosa TaxID=278164 RepID=A0AAV6HKC0_9TELE|nr:hypothetical protein AALO_G00018280 [Alosa alosa]
MYTSFYLSDPADAFYRITMVNQVNGQAATPKLLNLFQAKGGTIGLRLQAILLKAPTNPNANLTRDVVIGVWGIFRSSSKKV